MCGMSELGNSAIVVDDLRPEALRHWLSPGLPFSIAYLPYNSLSQIPNKYMHEGLSLGIKFDTHRREF